MIDFHTHILPDMDDGSRSVAESIQMLEEISRQGIRCIAATPHFYAEKEDPETFLFRRTEAEAHLREAIGNRTDLSIICMGAEVRYYEGFSRTQALAKLKIQNTDLLLLEMPFTTWNDRMMREIQYTQERLSCTIVLAHIERYLRYQKGCKFWDQIEEAGILVQSNAEFFLSATGKRKALQLLKSDRIHLLGSDCHGIQRRPPNLGDAISLINDRLGTGSLERIMEREQRLLKIEQ